MNITEIYNQKCADNSDICQHMPTLRRYAEKCDVVIELGVRSIVSTWAFLIAKPKKLISLDIQYPTFYIDYDTNGCDLDLVYKIAKEEGVDFEFIQGDSIKTELPSCDLMFFDTLHTYYQLRGELEAHSSNVKKYMIFHDTETYRKDLWPAIHEVLKTEEWAIEEKFTNNNGLMILKRTS